MSLEFERRLAGDQKRIEEALGAIFREDDRYADLQEAMEYSLMAGGKRVRPVLTLECCRLCGGDPERALPFACGVEMVHTYSLIHDDLPCMDDDDLRRGRPTNHRVYGEATAVLAGDGLLTAAFQMLTARRDLLSPEQMAEGVDCLSRAAGPSGMVGGQVLDMAGEGHSLSLAEVEELQRLKTGALIAAAAEMGCIVAGGTQEQRQAVRHYAERLGLAFQVRDDILDVVGDEATLGKPIGSDARSEKTTFVTLKGLDACRTLVKRLTGEAIEALAPFGGEGGALCWLAEQLAGREK